MPVVELNLSRLQKLVGKNVNKKQILDSLPFLAIIPVTNGLTLLVELSTLIS